MRIQVNARNRGFEFESRTRESVLYAGLRAGIDLPYECATGTCGTCKAKLISGRLHDGWREAPGRKYVKPEQHEFLMCQCAAEGDLMLEVSKFVYTMEPGACTPDACTGILRAPCRLAHDVMAFGVELEQPRDFDRTAALQHIIKRVEPLSCFGGVEVHRVFGGDVSHGNGILSARRIVASRPGSGRQ